MASRIQGITVEIGGDTTKLSKALESVNKSIKGTQSGLKDVNKLLKLDPSNTELVVQKQKMLKDAIEATKEKLATLKTAAQQANEQLANGEITQQQYDALQREIVETEQNLRSLQDQAATTNATLAKIDEAGEKLQNIGSSVENVGKKFLPVTAAVTGLGTAAVKTAADFDSEMSKVSAISGATGDDFDQLRAKAREMGAKTKFSASEAASAMEYMAMAGWKTSDMLNGIEGVMNLAAASGEDLATTSDIVTDALTAFGLSAADINLKRMLGYELGANKQWVIVPEQAEIIRYIFDRFVKGQTANKIALELNQMEKFTVNGKKWSASSILIVLRNEKYVGDIEMQKTITKDFLTHRSSINKGEAPRYYVKNHHVGIIDRVTWDKVQTMLFEKPRADMTKGPGKKKVKSIKGSPFGNLRCGAILENGPDAGKPCGEGFFRTTYTGVANGYSDERSLKATGEDTGEYLEKYTYSYPVWRCKRKVGERDGEPPKNGSPDQKAYCRSKKGCMSDEEKEAANKRCPSERYHECALEQSFMELLYSMKRDFEQHGDASMIVAMFDNAYEQAVRLANNNSISVQRMATVENQIKEMEERLQDAISHQVAALREAALEQNVELNEALSNGEVTIDDIDLDIRSGLTPGSIGVSFYGTETEEGSEAQIYTELVNDLQERLKTLQQERQTIEEEQGVLAIMKKNFEYFLACLKELPDTNAGGMPLRVNGLDVQGTLLRDVDGNAIEGRKRAITSGKLKLTPERIAEAPDMLHFEKGIYCAFVESGVLQGDVATYKTNFGVTLTSKGNRRTLDSFMGYKRSDMDGNVVYVDAPYKVYGFSIQYRRYWHQDRISC